MYWLIKSEPDTFSFDDLLRDGRTNWDGVRNYAARNNLRAMKKGDLALFYHSNEGLEVVGIARVSKEHFPDTSAESGDWSAVEFEPFKKLEKTVPLPLIKKTEALQQIGLVRNGRLSVMPLNDAEFRCLLEMGETEL